MKVFAIYRSSEEANAIQEICADDICQLVDIEHIFLNSDVPEGHSILIYHFDNLDPVQEHSITMRVTKHPDALSVKSATVSHIEYTEVVLDKNPEYVVLLA